MHYFEYVVAASLTMAAMVVLAGFIKLFRKYGSLLFGGVPYAMDGENIVKYAHKYFPDEQSKGMLPALAGVWQHGKDREKVISNMEKHLDLIRDALFNPANPAYAPVALGRLPSSVIQALMPDFLGLYGKGWRYKVDLMETAKAAAEHREVRWRFEAIGAAPIIDNWHRRRHEIYGIMQGYMRYHIGSTGIAVWVFDMGSDLTSPYDNELAEDFDLYSKLPSITDLAERAKAAESRFNEPPKEEFLAPPPFLEFKEKGSKEGGHLHRGYIFLGSNIRDGKWYWKKISELQHHLIVGISGYGKSVFLNQVLQGVRHNLDYFEKVYLVDLKGGVELVEYEDYGEQFEVFFRYEELHQLVQGLVDLMNTRLDDMRKNRVKKWTGKRILFMVDEFAQIALQSPENKEEKAAHVRLLANLNKLSMLGRGAGVLLWIQLQKATTDVMDSSFRNNLQAQVCFRVSSRLAAAMLFGEAKDLEIDPTRLRRGQCIYYDDATGETVYLQSHMRNEQEAAQ